MAILSIQTIDRAGDGLLATYATAAVGGDSFPNTGREFLHVKNGSGAPITVTASTPQIVSGLAVAEETYAVGAAAERFVGPFPPGTFNDSNGRVALTYSGVTSLTIAVLKVG